jgi:geranylgeranyl diphosphate synthase type I
MSLKQFMDLMVPQIEIELQSQIARLNQPQTLSFHEMLRYHMGWDGEGAGPEATGKRIRPLMVLLSAACCGVEWTPALPAAAAVELVHNFSLVHDDIQDNSDKRRGRATVWAKWGVPMAINVGDALFVLSNQALLDLSKSYSAPTVLRTSGILHDTCLDLTRGQYLDMSYESRTDLTIEDYWPMISGKTSVLLSACTYIGAILGGANEKQQEAYRLFGYHLGLAFQVQDDILGIWGDEAITGKSAASDLLEGKNSLPVLYSLGKRGRFAERWAKGPITPDEVGALAKLLQDEGGRAYATSLANKETGIALDFLEDAQPTGGPGEAILELANKLLHRTQ